TALGFLPVVRTDDVIGDYVRSLFWVVLVTLAVSLVFSFAVTPLLVRGVRREGRPEGVLTRAYRRVLTRSVRAPVVAVFVLLALCLGGWRAFESAEQIFFPASARPLWTLEVELPAGATLERTRDRVASLEERLAREASSEDGALEGWVTFLGRSAPRFQTSLPAVHHAPHYAQLLLRLDEQADVAPLERGLREWIAAASTPANGDAADGPVRARLRPVRLGAELEWPVEIDVHGPDEEVVARAAAAVAERITAAGGTHVHDDRGEPIRKRRVVLDRAALAEKGATAADVTVGIHAAVH